MAMLAIEGFDNVDNIAELLLKPVWSGSSASGISFNTGRDGIGRALRNAATNNAAAKAVTFGGTADTIIIGFATRSDVFNGNANWVEFREGATPHGAIRIDSSGRFAVYRSSTTLIATGTFTLSVGVWYYIEIEFHVDNAAGYATIRVNGVEVEDLTGLDTQQAGTGFIDNIELDAAAPGGANTDFDDLYILDTTGSAPYNAFLGDCRIETLRPNAAGDSTDFTPSAGSNFQNVDDTPGPDDDTTYNESSTVGHKDLYNLGALADTYDTIFAVKPEVFARKNDVGDRSINTVVKSDTTESDGSVLGLSADYQFFVGAILTADPDTAAAWTAAGVNAAQVGLEIAA